MARLAAQGCQPRRLGAFADEVESKTRLVAGERGERAQEVCVSLRVDEACDAQEEPRRRAPLLKAEPVELDAAVDDLDPPAHRNPPAEEGDVVLGDRRDERGLSNLGL